LLQQLGPSLNVAIWKEDLDVVDHLLEEMPALANWCDPSTGNCPLHIAARTGNIQVMRMLLEVGADKDKCSHKGYTALHVAAWSGFVPCVKLLLSSGCNVHQEARRKTFLVAFLTLAC
jgi:ankyrin repeat protein